VACAPRTRTHSVVFALTAPGLALRSGTAWFESRWFFLPLHKTGPTTLVDATTRRIYNTHIEFARSETKRAANLKAHGLDFVDAPRVFEGVTYTFEDDRLSYGEQRLITLGLLAGIPVSIVHTETNHEIRIISFRKATNREANIFFKEIQN